MYAWDAVNEAFNEDDTIRSTLWSDSPGIGLTGTAYIEQALRWLMTPIHKPYCSTTITALS